MLAVTLCYICFWTSYTASPSPFLFVVACIVHVTELHQSRVALPTVQKVQCTSFLSSVNISLFFKNGGPLLREDCRDIPHLLWRWQIQKHMESICASSWKAFIHESLSVNLVFCFTTSKHIKYKVIMKKCKTRPASSYKALWWLHNWRSDDKRQETKKGRDFFVRFSSLLNFFVVWHKGWSWILSLAWGYTASILDSYNLIHYWPFSFPGTGGILGALPKKLSPCFLLRHGDRCQLGIG